VSKHLDQIVWKSIHERPLPKGNPRGLTNYLDLAQLVATGEDWETAWSAFLHEFMLFRQASFFQYPPPESFSRGYRAMLAGTAEVLCDEFQLPVPLWVHEPQYIMPELWDLYEWMFTGMTDEQNHRRIESSDPLYLKHGVVWRRRDLITL